MPVTLENKIKQMQVFNLQHEAYCGADCACSDITTTVIEENPRTGERAPRQVVKRVPVALTLLAKEKREGMRDSIITVPEVKAAIERGHLRIVEQTPMPPVAPARRITRPGKDET